MSKFRKEIGDKKNQIQTSKRNIYLIFLTLIIQLTAFFNSAIFQDGAILILGDLYKKSSRELKLFT